MWGHYLLSFLQRYSLLLFLSHNTHNQLTLTIISLDRDGYYASIWIGGGVGWEWEGGRILSGPNRTHSVAEWSDRVGRLHVFSLVQEFLPGQDTFASKRCKVNKRVTLFVCFLKLKRYPENFFSLLSSFIAADVMWWKNEEVEEMLWFTGKVCKECSSGICDRDGKS